eukprot:CAMPEP_0197477660 /NCGR_PEP_ID=MMETSP1309-20131121/19642_1 /TAXON_ID=464262 /ORGANISM="Genus nov. species nov., Strain RCC998" /LENGTH=187 /DNA_ID=CAMNT_0043018731 /DNA_START=443 /DNA_END=1007 /DNA_ORIENTATION=-
MKRLVVRKRPDVQDHCLTSLSLQKASGLFPADARDAGAKEHLSCIYPLFRLPRPPGIHFAFPCSAWKIKTTARTWFASFLCSSTNPEHLREAGRLESASQGLADLRLRVLHRVVGVLDLLLRFASHELLRLFLLIISPSGTKTGDLSNPAKQEEEDDDDNEDEGEGHVMKQAPPPLPVVDVVLRGRQ